MGDVNTFKVNDDGSVTVSAQLSEQEQNIIEILRIEKYKGGVFASRRMKKRAISYAKSVNYPDFKVDKLMLDNYPDDFANYPKTISLIVWVIIGFIFLGGAITFVFPTYFEFETVSYYNKQIDACEEYQRTGDVEKYCRAIGRCIETRENFRIPIEELNSTLERSKDRRNRHLKDMIWFLLAVLGCAAIFYVSIRQCRRIAKDINPTIKNQL